MIPRYMDFEDRYRVRPARLELADHEPGDTAGLSAYYINATGNQLLATTAALPLPSIRLICHCCAIDRMLFTTQYSTRPAGKKKNITENTSGMIVMTLACTGSGGVGSFESLTDEQWF